MFGYDCPTDDPYCMVQDCDPEEDANCDPFAYFECEEGDTECEEWANMDFDDWRDDHAWCPPGDLFCEIDMACPGGPEGDMNSTNSTDGTSSADVCRPPLHLVEELEMMLCPTTDPCFE